MTALNTLHVDLHVSGAFETFNVETCFATSFTWEDERRVKRYFFSGRTFNNGDQLEVTAPYPDCTRHPPGNKVPLLINLPGPTLQPLSVGVQDQSPRDPVLLDACVNDFKKLVDCGEVK